MTYKFTNLKDNDLYNSTIKSYNDARYDESLTCMQGFIFGLIARGFSSSNRQVLNYAIELLHGGESLPGIAIANFTTLLIELERQIEQEKISFFIPSIEDNTHKLSLKDFNKTRLEALHDLVYGLSLGLSLSVDVSKEHNLKTTFGAPLAHEVNKDKLLLRQKNPELDDDLHTLEEILKIDTASHLQETDLQDVCAYLEAMIYRQYKHPK